MKISTFCIWLITIIFIQVNIKLGIGVILSQEMCFMFEYLKKPLTLWITASCRKFWKEWEYQTTSPASWETCLQVRKQQLEPDMEQRTGSKLGKVYVKADYCHPPYLTYVKSASWDILGWMKHKWESRLPGETSVTSDMQMTPPLWQKLKS